MKVPLRKKGELMVLLAPRSSRRIPPHVVLLMAYSGIEIRLKDLPVLFRYYLGDFGKEWCRCSEYHP